MLIYTDNAPYHGKQMFKRLYKETDGSITVEFLPPYTLKLMSNEI